MPDEAQLRAAKRSDPVNTTRSTPAACSAQALLAKDPPLRDGVHRSLLYYIQHWETGVNPVAFVTERMGGPTSTLEFEGVDWAVWLNEDYILYICTDGSYVDLDVSAIGLEPALKALRWDLKMGDYCIPRAEHKALHAKGYAEGLKVKYPIQDVATKDELKKFVMAYCDGQILCDHQVRDSNIMGMVFMPLILGAFAIKAPEEGAEPSPEYLAQKALDKDIGPEPCQTPPPPTPVKPAYPPEPPKPANWREPDPEQVKIIEEDIRWNVAPPERLENYLEEIRLHNVGVDYHRQQALTDWEAQKAAIDETHKKAMAQHKKTVDTLRAADRRFAAKHRKWEIAKARQKALLSGFQAGRMSDLGVIYEEYSKAGPRSINGYPCFFSFRVLSRNDWERARKAINRELEHRESMEVE